MSSRHFSFPVVLCFLPRRGTFKESHLKLIDYLRYALTIAGPGLVLTPRQMCFAGTAHRPLCCRAASELMEETQSGVGIVKWPVAQVVRKQALHIKLSLY